MMNCCYSMFDRQKTYSLISSREYCQGSLLSQISGTLQPEFRSLVKWSYTVVITATPWHFIERTPVNSLCCDVGESNRKISTPRAPYKTFGWHLLGRTFVSTIYRWTHSLSLAYIENLYGFNAAVCMSCLLSK